MNFDISRSREKRLSFMRERVESAFLNRVEQKTTQINDSEAFLDDSIESHRSRADQLRDLPDETEITWVFDPAPNVAWVDNPHDYPDLLRSAFETMQKNGFWTRQDTEKLIQELLEHEFGHHVPGLGSVSLKARYLVSFFQNQNGMAGFTPSVNFAGKLTIALHRDILFGPSKQSPHDLAGHY